MDGAIHVIYGALAVYSLSFARYVLAFILFVCHGEGASMTELLASVCLQGETLFQTHENLEHLAMMERVLGPLPRHMLERAEYVPIIFKYLCRCHYQDLVPPLWLVLSIDAFVCLVYIQPPRRKVYQKRKVELARRSYNKGEHQSCPKASSPPGKWDKSPYLDLKNMYVSAAVAQYC
jgi:hypothetical protein